MCEARLDSNLVSAEWSTTSSAKSFRNFERDRLA